MNAACSRSDCRRRRAFELEALMDLQHCSDQSGDVLGRRERTSPSFEAAISDPAANFEVFLPEGRKRILSTKKEPFRYICKLQADPSVGNCTGTLIAEDKVLTAAHCLTTGIAAADIVVIPAKRGPGTTRTNEPFGRVRVTRIDRHPSVSNCGGRDFAVLTLATRVGRETGVWSRMRAMDPKWLQRVKVNIAGYPRDKHSHGDQLWFSYDDVVGAGGTVIEYANDTFAGMSGAPIWIRWQGLRSIVGIHLCADQPGAPRGNRGLLFTDPILTQIRSWAA